jgi:hypothetical protein
MFKLVKSQLDANLRKRRNGKLGGCGIQIILYRRAKAIVYGGRPFLHFLIDYKL